MTLAEIVLEAMRETAERAIMPRFCALREGDIEEKSPGEVVTLADREAEAFLTPVLRSLRPDAAVVAEEACTAEPALLEAVYENGAVWLLDPLDGTSNFIAGTPDFAVMVALMEHGQTTHAWIWRPADSEAWVAERGAGVTRNGRTVRLTGSRNGARLRGSVRTRFLDDEHRAFAEAAAPSLGAEILPGSGCAGIEYPDLVTGHQDFVLFRRTLPWDHAPGALILQEAGGVVRRWDGSDYAPGDGKEGMIAAGNQGVWSRVEGALLQPHHRAATPFA